MTYNQISQKINVFHGRAAPEEGTLVGYGAIIIPQEVAYLRKYDAFKQYIDDEFEIPDRTVALLVRFLEQNEGTLSSRSMQKEFSMLGDDEVRKIEENFKIFFRSS